MRGAIYIIAACVKRSSIKVPKLEYCPKGGGGGVKTHQGEGFFRSNLSIWSCFG